MLRNTASLRGYAVHATDGDIGHVEDFYFDDESWIIRYLVVETGAWLAAHPVLIANNSIGATLWDERKVAVKLARAQIEGAPGIETEQPVTRRHEASLFDYYGYPYYWAGTGLDGMAGLGAGPLLTPPPAVVAAVAGGGATAATAAEDTHLQSTSDVTGFSIEAADGAIGHVEDFIVDDQNWTIRYLEVDTRNWWPGKKVLLAPSWIRRIDWASGQVEVKLLRDVIRQAPEYDPARPITQQYEVSLFDHYGQYLDEHGNFRYWLPVDKS